MPVSNDFLEYVLDQFAEWGGVSGRKMFGGVGLYKQGKMFGLLANNVAYLKVDKTNKEKYLTAGSSPFKPSPHKPTTMSYFEIPPDILENPEELIKWAEESLLIQNGGEVSFLGNRFEC